MKNWIFGIIGILWGGGMLVRWLLGGAHLSFAQPYEAGQSFAVVIGFILMVLGAIRIKRAIAEATKPKV